MAAFLSFPRRPLLPAFAALIAPFALHAADSTASKPSVSTDREEALYQPGEEITFTIGSPAATTRYGRMEWKATLDGVKSLKTGGERLKEGSTTVTIPANEPGFIRLDAEVNQDTRLARPKKERAFIVAGVAPEQLRPGSAAPEDFESYWASQKEFLASVPPKAQMTSVPSGAPQIETFDVQVDSATSKPVSGYYARPEGAAEKSLPAILFLHSAGVRSAVKSTVVDWAKKNMLAFDVNAHGIPNGQDKKFYEDLSAGELARYPYQGCDSRDNYYFNGVYLRIVRAIDFLTAQPEWDGRTLVVYGSSQGGAQAIVAAGLDSRVTFYAAAVPALCDLSADLAGRTPGWPPKLLPSGRETIVREVVRYYDVANFAPKVKVPGIVSVGFVDTTCPPSSVYAMYNVLGGEKHLFVDPKMGHAFTDGTRKAFEEAVKAHVDR